MNKLLISLATIATISFGGVAAAAHMTVLTEGTPFRYSGASFCVDEESAVSIIRDLEKNGMASSIEVYQDLVAKKKCVSDNNLGVFTPLRLVYKWKEALVAEGTKRGVTLYFVSPNSEYIKGGEPI